MTTNQRTIERDIRQLRDGQEANLQALIAIATMLKSLGSQLEHPDPAAMDFNVAQTRLEGVLRAEIIRAVLPWAMTQKLSTILKVYLDAGDAYLSRSTVAEKAGLYSATAVRSTVGHWDKNLRKWLQERDLDPYFLRVTLLEWDVEGDRLYADLRDAVRGVLDKCHE